MMKENSRHPFKQSHCFSWTFNDNILLRCEGQHCLANMEDYLPCYNVFWGGPFKVVNKLCKLTLVLTADDTAETMHRGSAY